MPTKKNADRHKQKTVSFRLPEALMECFRALASRNRRTLSGEVRIAIENHLAASGMAADDDAPGRESPRSDGRKRSKSEE
jgi:hypothetical protein